MEASKNGNGEIAQLLLEKGSDPNQTNSVSNDRVGYSFEVFASKYILYMLTGKQDSTDGSSQ